LDYFAREKLLKNGREKEADACRPYSSEKARSRLGKGVRNIFGYRNYWIPAKNIPE
jgi:hypothetical protein